jgi:DNA-binding XRE family transcriptional regulator
VMEIKTAADLRMLAAKYDLKQQELAARIGISRQYMHFIYHGQWRIPEMLRIRIERTAAELEANPPEPKYAPRVRSLG